MTFYYVYVIQSIYNPGQIYVGITKNLKARLKKHNEGGSPHTSKFKPWKLKVAVLFADKQKAFAFEKYLKSHSGRVFRSRHF
jgi:predicted GIY-YIG superfamily endonuclease